jgi:hypothetical protein
MKDIVERLRDCHANYDCIGEAADEIERLQAKLSKAVEALKAAEALAVCGMATDCYSRFEIDQISRATIETFRATLKEVGGDNE